ncbi:hypothetical protein HSBAA_30790 [Vreelandella sulfidaeris]|uniref:Protein RecA n=1 Tax=Vreelandella sulfidaeris TaxID=115553 RepID=A0A455U955_9GAMM|nr:hypothetical protein HSBAA_30790 [Halomonas sulfidaeris]
MAQTTQCPPSPYGSTLASLPLNRNVSGRYDGGMPCGRVVELSGPESSGKTAIANECMKSAQKTGGIAAFFDHERSFDTEQAEKSGLDLTPGRFVYKRV